MPIRFPLGTYPVHRFILHTKLHWPQLIHLNPPEIGCSLFSLQTFKVRLHWTRSNAKRRLATFANCRLHYLLKIGQPHNRSFVEVKLSNCSRSLRPVATFRKLLTTQILVTSHRFALLRVQCKRTFKY